MMELASAVAAEKITGLARFWGSPHDSAEIRIAAVVRRAEGKPSNARRDLVGPNRLFLARL